MKNLLKYLRCSDSLWAPLIATTLNILLLYVVAFCCRVEFYLQNFDLFQGVDSVGSFFNIAIAALRFDTPGIFYVNLIYILMMLFPLRFKERRGYYSVCKWVYVVLNSVAILANLADSIYYPYTLRRTTWDVTREFSNETNIASIVGVEILHHFWILLLAILLIFILIKCYVTPLVNKEIPEERRVAPGWQYYSVMGVSLALAAAISVSAVRGGWLNHWYLYFIAIPLFYIGWRMRKRSRPAVAISFAVALSLICIARIGGWRHRDIRPIALSNANAYARHPSDVALILNTPFSLIRTLNDNPFPIPDYFHDADEMAAIYTPVHPAHDSLTAPMDRRNVVVIILESFGEEYIDALNDRALGKNSPGYAPFMDSLVAKSVTFRYSYDNGNKSIDAMPSILASIPKFGKSFILTSAAMRPIPGLPALLRDKGYATAFFHGARTGSMGFDGFARSVGFDKYFGRENFEADRRFGGEEEFDGYWAIWDEPFFQYFAMEMDNLPQPFMAAIFSATSHHPFRVPDKYEGVFPKGTLPIHQTIGYTDRALREFFATASKQPWYDNTLFVITNDHTNDRAYPQYRSEIGTFYGPILFFDPSGSLLEPGSRDGIMSQIDIMPTILGLLRYPDSYIAFGNDMSQVATGGDNPAGDGNASGIPEMSTAGRNPEVVSGSAVSFINNVYQLVAEGYILRFDGQKSIGLYAIDDHLMSRNLLAQHPEVAGRLERRLKALIQTYMTRMHDQ